MHNLYEYEDIKKLYGTNRNIAAALGIDPAQITRWGGIIPDAKQLQIMRIMDGDRHLDRQHKRIVRERRGRNEKSL